MKKYTMQDDFDYYIKHQDELVRKYNDKFIVISHEEVLGAFDSLDTAIKAARKKVEPGEFIVQQVGPGEENYTKVVSRVRFYAQ